jgi:hypothetical protein
MQFQQAERRMYIFSLFITEHTFNNNNNNNNNNKIKIIIKTNIQNTICLLIHSDHLNTTDAATASLARDETWKMGTDVMPCQTSKCFDGGWIMKGSLHIRLKSP